MRLSIQSYFTVTACILITCCEEDGFHFTRGDAEKVDVPMGATRIDAFGGDPPYKYAGGHVGVKDMPMKFRAFSDGRWIERDYVGIEGARYFSVNFVNAMKEGFVIVYRANSDSRDGKGEQAGTGQPATRPELKSDGGDKPQPEVEGRSR